MTLPPFDVSNPKLHLGHGVEEYGAVIFLPAFFQVPHFSVKVLLELIASPIEHVIGVFERVVRKTDFRCYHEGCRAFGKQEALISVAVSLLPMPFYIYPPPSDARCICREKVGGDSIFVHR